jgi:DnaK suppressor protein
MDSWNPTDPEHLADTESGEDETPGRPPEDAGYDVTDEVQVDVFEVGEVDVIDVVDQVEVVDVIDQADVTDEADEVLAPAYDEDQGDQQSVVDTAPAAPAASDGPAGTTTPEASIDEVEAVLDQVDEALARLDDGTYGRCVNCGQSIQDDRLAEDPTDQRCGECVELVLSGVD